MSQTKINAIIASVISWTIALVVPFSSWLYDSSYAKLLTLLVYPLIMALLSREGFFWVRPEFVALSSVLTFLTGLLMRTNKKIKKALDDPSNHKQLAFWMFLIMIFVFIGTMYIIGNLRYLYNPSNF